VAFTNQDQFVLSKSRRRKRDKEQVELLILEAPRRKKSNHFSSLLLKEEVQGVNIDKLLRDTAIKLGIALTPSSSSADVHI
jgi:hypothetical protein